MTAVTASGESPIASAFSAVTATDNSSSSIPLMMTRNQSFPSPPERANHLQRLDFGQTAPASPTLAALGVSRTLRRKRGLS